MKARAHYARKRPPPVLVLAILSSSDMSDQAPPYQPWERDCILAAMLLAVAAVSKVGNDQHNPGKPLHWDRSKSTDEGDALVRHLLDPDVFDNDKVRHRAQAAWRALALLQKEIESDKLGITGR